jgi:hypothetical protein
MLFTKSPIIYKKRIYEKSENLKRMLVVRDDASLNIPNKLRTDAASRTSVRVGCMLKQATKV